MTQPRSYAKYALDDLLDAFASNSPVPGGGSAAAVAGALGASLLMMAASLPKSRTGAPEEAADLAEAAARLRPIRDRLIELIDEDARAYRAVMSALKLPKGSAEEQSARRDALQSAVAGATDAPLDVMRACQQGLAGGVVVARNAYKVAASDVATGIELLSAAGRGAALSIDGNLSSGVADASYADRVRAERDELAADSERDAAQALDLVNVLPRPRR